MADAARLQRLTAAIEAHPAAPSNYVLRGELYLAQHDPAAAEADFLTAQQLAAAELAERAWGIIAQAMFERATLGLAQAQRALGRPTKRKQTETQEPTP